jgi:hypothetical protein
VSSGGIVERLDVFCDLATGDRAILVDLLLDVLLLQTAEEGFSDGIVPTVSSTAHAWDHLKTDPGPPPGTASLPMSGCR